MKLKNNKYYRLDISIEELAKCKIRININKLSKNIEDIELIEGEEPNILIYMTTAAYPEYYGEEERERERERKVDFTNIYPSVKILITTAKEIRNRYMEIPEYIETIIVGQKIYKNNKNMFDYIRYNKYEVIKESFNRM